MLTESTANALIKPPRTCILTSGGPCHACLSLAEVDRQNREPAGRVSESPDAASRSRKYEVLLKLNEHHDPFFRHLPIEISGQILLQCLLADDDTDSGYHRNLNRRTSLGIFMSLCKNWRQIALSTPALWTILYAHRPEHIRVAVPDIDAYLERSGGLPLIVDLDLDEKFWSLAQSHYVLRAICRHAIRWKALKLRAPHAVIATIAEHTSALRDGVPNLVYVDVSGLGSSRDSQACETSSSRTFGIGSQDAPAPSPIEIVTNNIIISDTTFDLTRLTSLTLDFTPSSSRLRDTLVSAPRLRVLNAKVGASDTRRPRLNMDRTDGSTASAFSHSSLEHLDLTVFDANDLNFFDMFTLPVLVTLKFKVVYGSQQAVYRGLYNFVLRSHCPLETLDLSLLCTEEQLLQVLRLTPTLRELKIEKIPLRIHFFNYLGETALPGPGMAGSNIFLPHLVAFRYDNTHRPFNISLLRNMVRIAGPSEYGISSIRPLRSIEVVLNGNITSEGGLALSGGDEVVVLDLINDGVDISILVHSRRGLEDVVGSSEGTPICEARRRLRERERQRQSFH